MAVSYAKFNEEKTTQVIDKFGGFFAFSNKQVDEALIKNKENGFSGLVSDYCSLGAGLIVPKATAKEFLAEWDKVGEQGKKEYLETYTKEEIIGYELNNHEYGYTYDLTDTFEAVEHLGFTLEDVREVAKKLY
ncbi:hypothetical protein SL034_004316 [Vibrio harveyi]|uniref:DUF7659 family protein n=1 Tax=Vibrio harveyi group TaxID=717610 RepID=UPI000971B5EE|nr:MULTISPECIES: hypothetical protein [Vibrio harveyi group]ELY1989228.1 hypothetical protein [Vibrio harveyi]APX10072.1 hypothetical protein BWP24_28190 [Vibrio campbellii]ARR10526.1 hypothetical protein Vc3S01_p40040 [Vibrio campbellii]WCP78839.1 hypothetical protein PPW95_25390 [Vibrio parahaemolyticus]WHP52967.1 hypothetical protein QMY43_24925 [Vibrio parahaemolyticus]